MADQDLFFVTHNEQADETIILLHGLCNSHLEWSYVAAHLPNYHLIVPDLPQHSGSKHIQPYSQVLAAEKVASLIRKYAKGGRAHVVGISNGGFATMELIRNHASVVKTAFISGSTVYLPVQMWAVTHPKNVSWMLWAMVGSGFYRMQTWWINMKPHDELRGEIWKNNSISLFENAFGGIFKTWHSPSLATDLGKSNVRVLIAAGDQGDDVEGTGRFVKSIVEAASGETKKSIALRALGYGHGWNLQVPERFAAAIDAWIKGMGMPDGTEVMNLEKTQ
jgi:pimeloyl-ACP methyl ester carboxylesterase